MILLFSFYPFIFSLSERYCNDVYDDHMEVMERCLLKGTSSFKSHKQTAIYLHNNEKSKLSVKIQDENESIIINEGQGIQIIDSRADVTCQEPLECFITIWHTSFDKEKSQFASDGAGCSVYKNDVIPFDFSLFFDFGDSARLSSGNFEHKRETGIMVYYTDKIKSNETIPIVIPKNTNFNLEGPAILKISSSAYAKANFDIVIGSTIKIPKTFSNIPNTGKFIQYTKAEKFTQNSIMLSSSDDVKVLMAKERRSWYYISIAMCGLTVVLFLISIISISIIFSSYRKRKAKMAHAI